MSSTRKRKRDHVNPLNSPEKGQENKGCACKVAKVDPEVAQSENNSPRDLTDSYIDPNWWTSYQPNEPPPLFDSVASVTSLSPLHTAPLTEENLQALDEAMPLKKDSNAVATTASSAESINRALHVLKVNNIHLEHKDAKERGKGLIQEARRIVTGPRHSEMGVPQSEALSETASKLSLDDELTFLAGVWNLLIGKHRTVEHMDVNEKLVFVETAWEKDHLKCNWTSPFAANITPPLRYADPKMEAWISYVPKLKNSVPDLTYGYHEDTFTPDQMNANDTINGEICRRNWHPFLIVEAKSIDLPFLQGVAQALRAAAATINLKRKLIEEARSSVIVDSSNTQQHSSGAAESSTSALEGDTTPAIPDPNSNDPELTSGEYRYKADVSSFIFTFVICPENARLYVAWAEEAWAGNNHNKPGINYHMHALRHYYFSDGGEPWAAIRHDLNNVMDWGVGPRKTQVLNLLDDVASKKKDGRKRART